MPENQNNNHGRLCFYALKNSNARFLLKDDTVNTTNVRYTGSGIAYNVASILGAALTPFSAVWLAKTYGVGSVGIYLTTLSALTFIAIWWSKETRHTSLDTQENESFAVSVETTSP